MNLCDGVSIGELFEQRLASAPPLLPVPCCHAQRLMSSEDTGCQGVSERGVMAGRALTRSCISRYPPGLLLASPPDPLQPSSMSFLPVRLREAACLPAAAAAAALSEWMLLSTHMCGSH